MGEHRGGLDEVCRREFGRLIGLVALQVGDRQVAEELAQDVLAELIRQWDRVERPQAWLTRVAVNRANSWLRRRAAERRAYRRHGQSPDVHHDPATAEVAAVRRAVSALPRRQRTAVVLRFYEQYSVAETAAFMGCAPGTVKALTYRAMATLRSGGQLVGEEASGRA